MSDVVEETKRLEAATKRLEAIKNIVWNILMYLYATALLLVGWYFGSSLINDGLALEDMLKILAVVLGIPAFVVMAAWDRVPGQAVATIISAIIGFALGKIGG
jgi:hypothetical protein